MQYFTFNKEDNGKWYIVLPTWNGSKDDLEMVLGADTMLEILAQGEDTVNVNLSLDMFDNYTFKLTFMYEENEGAWYKLTSDLYTFDVWLCYVTKFVFSHFPIKIYI